MEIRETWKKIYLSLIENICPQEMHAYRNTGKKALAIIEKRMMPKIHLVKVDIQFLLKLPQILLLRLG